MMCSVRVARWSHGGAVNFNDAPSAVLYPLSNLRRSLPLTSFFFASLNISVGIYSTLCCIFSDGNIWKSWCLFHLLFFSRYNSLHRILVKFVAYNTCHYDHTHSYNVRWTCSRVGIPGGNAEKAVIIWTCHLEGNMKSST